MARNLLGRGRRKTTSLEAAPCAQLGRRHARIQAPDGLPTARQAQRMQESVSWDSLAARRRSCAVSVSAQDARDGGSRTQKPLGIHARTLFARVAESLPPAMLAALRGCNVDAQVPYRLPFKCRNCGDDLSPSQRHNVIEAAQRAQDAQTGYGADYCAKCQPMAFHEINEFRKGHVALHNRLAGADVERLGKRHTARFLSDAYCKGIVRGQVGCCNLRANHVEDACVASERFSATNFVSFPGREFLHLVQWACGDLGAEATRSGTRATARGRRLTHLRDLDLAQAYGLRPRSADLWHASLCEFVMCWETVATRVPYTWQAWKALPADAWDVNLTAAGAKKLDNANKVVRLKPGADYTNKFNSKPNAGVSRTPWPQEHAWYFKRRRRVRDTGQKARSTTQLFAKRIFVTLQKRWSTPQVPLASCLKGGNESWDGGCACEETMRHVRDFLSVHRVRLSEEAAENSDDDDADTALDLSVEHFRRALEPPAREIAAGTKRKLASEELTVAACERANATWASSEGTPTDSTNPFARSDAKRY